MLAWHEVLTDFTAWHKILTNISDHRLEKPPPRIASRPILIYLEFRGKPLTVTVIWMDPHSLNKLIATKYCFPYSGMMIPVSFSFLMLCCLFLIINLYKNIHYYYYFFFFFIKINLIFSCSEIFLDFPECSGMFRNFLRSGQFIEGR